MKPLNAIVIVLAAAPAACLGQNWEAGGAAGYSLFRNVTATASSASATAGFTNGPLFSVVGGQNVGEHLGGEFRYTFAYDDLKVSGSGQSARLDGESHAFEYDFLVYAQRRDAAVRFFVEGGGGTRLFRGTGREPTYQPLSAIAIPTRAQQFVPMVSFGGGVKFRAGRHALFRIDARDLASAFPKDVIAPMPPSGKIAGWLHGFVGMFGIGMTF